MELARELGSDILDAYPEFSVDVHHPQVMIHAKWWIPIIDGQNNKDILKYSGIYQTGIQYMSPNGRFGDMYWIPV